MDHYNAERYGPALVAFKKATDRYHTLEKRAQKLADANAATNEVGELYRAVYWLHYNMSEAAAADHLAASDMGKGDAAVAADHLGVREAHVADAFNQMDASPS